MMVDVLRTVFHIIPNPGIPLFNYEDREGWYLYDPTCIPYYRVYDDKPTIINVDYVIYTKDNITQWCMDFGKKDSNLINILWSVTQINSRKKAKMLEMAGNVQFSNSKLLRANMKKQ